jgi:hypothetical protein
MQVTIDSFAGGAAVLNARLKRGTDTIWTGQLAAAASTGIKYAGGDLTTTLSGTTQALTLYMWVDVGTCVISVVEFWIGPGTYNPSSSFWGLPIYTLTYSGMVQASGQLNRIGTGNFGFTVSEVASPTGWDNYVNIKTYVPLITSRMMGETTLISQLMMSVSGLRFNVGVPSVTTDGLFFYSFALALRSML